MNGEEVFNQVPTIVNDRNNLTLFIRNMYITSLGKKSIQIVEMYYEKNEFRYAKKGEVLNNVFYWSMWMMINWLWVLDASSTCNIYLIFWAY